MKKRAEEDVQTFREKVKAELEGIMARHPRKILHAGAVVLFARDKKTALHRCFDWDDKRAAHSFRLVQARRLIGSYYLAVTEEAPEETRLFVSLRSDRVREGGGYRLAVNVLTRADQRRELLSNALAELRTFTHKYAALRELAAVFRESERLLEGEGGEAG